MVLIQVRHLRTTALSNKDTEIKESPFHKLFGISMVSNPLLDLPLETRSLYSDFQKEVLMGKP